MSRSVEEQLTRVLGTWAAASVAAGAAVAVQGAFLLLLDVTAAQRLR